MGNGPRSPCHRRLTPGLETAVGTEAKVLNPALGGFAGRLKSPVWTSAIVLASVWSEVNEGMSSEGPVNVVSVQM